MLIFHSYISFPYRVSVGDFTYLGGDVQVGHLPAPVIFTIYLSILVTVSDVGAKVNSWDALFWEFLSSGWNF